MRIIPSRGPRLVAVIGAVVVLSAGVAAPASAAAGDTHARGLVCSGLVVCGPLAASNYPAGPPSQTALGISILDLDTGVINTTANAGGATASVANLRASLVPGVAPPPGVLLTATAVSSQCTIDPNTGAVSGSTSIVGGTITIANVPTPITVDASPAPNTSLTVIGVTSLVLNRQTLAADGTLTVDAIAYTMSNLQTIVVATSICTPPPAVGTPVIAPAFAAGAGVLGLLVLGVYVVRRRREPAASVSG